MARILLAEDDPAARDFIRRALEIDGHAVTAAADGIEAQEALRRSGPFDLVVSDVQMPGLDGIGLAKLIAADGANARVLLISGLAEELERARGVRGLRLNGITKPFTLEEIRAAVTKALGS